MHDAAKRLRRDHSAAGDPVFPDDIVELIDVTHWTTLLLSEPTVLYLTDVASVFTALDRLAEPFPLAPAVRAEGVMADADAEKAKAELAVLDAERLRKAAETKKLDAERLEIYLRLAGAAVDAEHGAALEEMILDVFAGINGAVRSAALGDTARRVIRESLSRAQHLAQHIAPLEQAEAVAEPSTARLSSAKNG